MELNEFEEHGLAYDLRVFYAIVIGRKMIAIEDASAEKRYSDWFRDLKLIFPILFSRVDKDRKNIKAKYVEILNATIQTINKHQYVYFKRKFDPVGTSEIEDALSRLQQFIYRILHTSNQFGKQIDVKGLS